MGYPRTPELPRADATRWAPVVAKGLSNLTTSPGSPESLLLFRFNFSIYLIFSFNF